MKCFICDNVLNIINCCVPSDHKILCPECYMHACKINGLTNSPYYEENIKKSGYVCWYYQVQFKDQLDAAKAAYIPVPISDWKCPECKIGMPHTKVEGVCAKCSVAKMLSE
jgi:hypothetical protein